MSSFDVSVLLQPPGVNHLEQRRVPVGGQRPLAFRAYGPVHLVIGIVQEPLQLLAGERPRLRAALIPVEVGDRVPLMADRHRVHTWPELVLAGRGPAIPAIAEVLAEQPQVRLVAPDRRRSQPLLRHQRLRPLIHVRRTPAPRVLVGELQEPADQPLPRRYRVLPQPARRLLSPPAAQHRLEHRVLRPQLHHPGHQLQMRRTSQITSPQPALQPQKQQPFEGRIMHQTGSTRNPRGQAVSITRSTRLLRDPADQATSANAPV